MTEHEHTTSAAPPSPLRYWLLLAAVTTLTILADQASKAYVARHLALHHSWMPLEFLRPVFNFTHVHNTGAAFGLFPEGGSVFLAIAVTVSTIILYYYRQLPPGALLIRIALGLQLGGALGNVIDRIRLGYVVDFLHVEYWPVFNVADSSIVVGVALLALEMLREEYRQKKEEDSARDAPDKQVLSQN